MAHAAINWVLEDANLNAIPAAERWLLVVVANHANKEHWQCWPSVGTLAEESGVSRRSVNAYLADLEARGFILRTPRYRANGSQTTDMITLRRGEGFAPHPSAEDGGGGVQSKAPKAAKSASPPNQGKEPGKGTEEANASVAGGDDVRQAFERFNRVAEEIGCSPAKALNDDRKRRLKARLKDCGGLEGWYAQMQRISSSPFLTGQTHHHFGLTLDFILQPSSFTKLVEGQYHDRSQTDATRRDQSTGPIDRGAARANASFDAMVDGGRETLDRRSADRAEQRRRWGFSDPAAGHQPDAAGGVRAALPAPDRSGTG